MDDLEPLSTVNHAVVEKLAVLLEQARRGEVTGFVGIVFMANGDYNRWSVLANSADRAQAPDALASLKDLFGEL